MVPSRWALTGVRGGNVIERQRADERQLDARLPPRPRFRPRPSSNQHLDNLESYALDSGTYADPPTQALPPGWCFSEATGGTVIPAQA
jgi:hypothetical protein